MALDKFNLDGQTIQYAVCPACHYTYKPLFKCGSKMPRYPDTCMNYPSANLHPNFMCDASLLRDSEPIKTFTYHSFHNYLAGLLTNPNAERVMDAACDNLMSTLSQSPLVTSDVLEAEYLHSFEGPIPNCLFIDRGTEGRYTFSLNVDFFAAEGKSIYNATISCGIISLACLNLPPNIRYKPEHMFLAGVIPGPKEPLLDQLNHYLYSLVDDLDVS
ncbi:hypothetical protein ABKN59_011906 [Abortiporus biennis]